MLSTATNSPGRFAGLTLKGWAVIDGTGTLVKGFNVTSTTLTTTTYTVNFTAALAGTQPIIDIGVDAIGGAGQLAIQFSTRSTTSPQFQVIVNGAATALNANFYLAFYE